MAEKELSPSGEQLKKFIVQLDHFMRENGVKSWVLSFNMELKDDNDMHDILTSDLTLMDIFYHGGQLMEFLGTTTGSISERPFVYGTQTTFDLISPENKPEEEDKQ